MNDIHITVTWKGLNGTAERKDITDAEVRDFFKKNPLVKLYLAKSLGLRTDHFGVA